MEKVYNKVHGEKKFFSSIFLTISKKPIYKMIDLIQSSKFKGLIIGKDKEQ